MITLTGGQNSRKLGLETLDSENTIEEPSMDNEYLETMKLRMKNQLPTNTLGGNSLIKKMQDLNVEDANRVPGDSMFSPDSASNQSG